MLRRGVGLLEVKKMRGSSAIHERVLTMRMQKKTVYMLISEFQKMGTGVKKRKAAVRNTEAIGWPEGQKIQFYIVCAELLSILLPLFYLFSRSFRLSRTCCWRLILAVI